MYMCLTAVKKMGAVRTSSTSKWFTVVAHILFVYTLSIGALIFGFQTQRVVWKIYVNEMSTIYIPGLSIFIHCFVSVLCVYFCINMFYYTIEMLIAFDVYVLCVWTCCLYFPKHPFSRAYVNVVILKWECSWVKVSSWVLRYVHLLTLLVIIIVT